MALDGVGVGHDGGEGPDEPHRLEQQVFHRGVVRIVVVGIQGQHAPGQLVHNIPAGMLHDHVLGKAVGQLLGLVHDLVEVGHLSLGGQVAHEQQEGHLFKAEGVCLPVGLHDLVELNAPVVQLAGHGHPDAVLDHVALNGTHLGDADGHAGAVAVAQAPLHISPVVVLVNVVLFPNALTEGTCVFFKDPGIVFYHALVPLSVVSKNRRAVLLSLHCKLIILFCRKLCKKKFLAAKSFGNSPPFPRICSVILGHPARSFFVHAFYFASLKDCAILYVYTIS